jgi:hypothetical protein
MDETPASPPEPFLSNRRLGWLLLVTVLVGVVTFFVADNFVIVDVRVFTLDIQTRLAWVMLICLLLGMTVGAALMALWRWRRG